MYVTISALVNVHVIFHGFYNTSDVNKFSCETSIYVYVHVCDACDFRCQLGYLTFQCTTLKAGSGLRTRLSYATTEEMSIYTIYSQYFSPRSLSLVPGKSTTRYIVCVNLDFPLWKNCFTHILEFDLTPGVERSLPSLVVSKVIPRLSKNHFLTH